MMYSFSPRDLQQEEFWWGIPGIVGESIVWMSRNLGEFSRIAQSNSDSKKFPEQVHWYLAFF